MNRDPNFGSLKIFIIIFFFVVVGLFISKNMNKNILGNQATVISPSSVWDNHQVQGLQSSLTLLGFYSGPTNGLFTPQTKRAVRAFQKANNIRGIGILNTETINELNEIVFSESVSRSQGESLDGGENPSLMQVMGGGTNCGIHFIEPGQSGVVDVPYEMHAVYDPTEDCLWDINETTGKVIDFYLYNWNWQVGGVGTIFVSEDTPPDYVAVPPGGYYLKGTVIPTGNNLVEGTYMTPSNWIGTKNGVPSSYMGFWLSYEPGSSNIENNEVACLENSQALILFLSDNYGEVPPPFCSQIETYTAPNYICEPPIVATLTNTPNTIQNGISGNQVVYNGSISSNSPGEDSPCDVVIQSLTVAFLGDGVNLNSFQVTASEGVFTDTGIFPTSLIDTFSLGTTAATKLELSVYSPNNIETISISAKDIVIPSGVTSIMAGPIEAMYKFAWEPGGVSRKVIFQNSLQALQLVD